MSLLLVTFYPFMFCKIKLLKYSLEKNGLLELQRRCTKSNRSDRFNDPNRSGSADSQPPNLLLQSVTVTNCNPTKQEERSVINPQTCYPGISTQD